MIADAAHTLGRSAIEYAPTCVAPPPSAGPGPRRGATRDGGGRTPAGWTSRPSPAARALPSATWKLMWPGLWPWVAIARMPGATSAPSPICATAVRHTARSGGARGRSRGGVPQGRGSPRPRRSRRPTHRRHRDFRVREHGGAIVQREQPADVVGVEMRHDHLRHGRGVQPGRPHVRRQHRPVPGRRCPAVAGVEQHQAPPGVQNGHVEGVHEVRRRHQRMRGAPPRPRTARRCGRRPASRLGRRGQAILHDGRRASRRP